MQDKHTHFHFCGDPEVMLALTRLETIMATVQDELKQARDGFEDLKSAVSARLDAVNAQVADLKDQLANQNLPADAQTGFDALESDMKSLADQIRSASPADGGSTVTAPADTGTTSTTDAGATDTGTADTGTAGQPAGNAVAATRLPGRVA